MRTKKKKDRGTKRELDIARPQPLNETPGYIKKEDERLMAEDMAPKLTFPEGKTHPKAA